MTDPTPTLTDEQRARDLTYAVMRHYGYTDEDIAAAEAAHPGDPVCIFERNTSVLIRRIGDMGHASAADWRCSDCAADAADAIAAATIHPFHPDFQETR